MRKDQKRDDGTEASSPAKNKMPRARANNARTKGPSKDKNPIANDGNSLAGQKRKLQQIYKVKSAHVPVTESVTTLAVVSHHSSVVQINVYEVDEDVSSNSNKKSKKNGSADQAGAVEQPRRNKYSMLELSQARDGRDSWRAPLVGESSSSCPLFSLRDEDEGFPCTEFHVVAWLLGMFCY